MNKIMLNFNDTIYKMIHKELTSVLESEADHQVIMANAKGKEGFHNYLHESNIVITDGFYFKDDKDFVQELNKLISRGRKTVIVINYQSFTPSRIEQEFIDELIKNGILRVCNVKNGESLDFEYIKLLLTKQPTSFQLKGFLGYTDDEYSDFYICPRRKTGMKTEMDSFKNPQATLDIDVDNILNDFILDEEDEIEEEVIDYATFGDDFGYGSAILDEMEEENLDTDNITVASAIETSDEVLAILEQVRKEEEMAELGVTEEDDEEEVLPQAEFDFVFNLDSLINETPKTKVIKEKPKAEAVVKEVNAPAEVTAEVPVAKKPKKPKKPKKKPFVKPEPAAEVVPVIAKEPTIAVAEIIPEVKPVVIEKAEKVAPQPKVALVDKAEANKNANRGPKLFDGPAIVKDVVFKEEEVMPKVETKEQEAKKVLNKTTVNFGENVRFMLRLNNVNPVMESIDYEKVLVIHLEVDQTTKYNLQSLDNILGSRMVNLDILSSNIMIEKNNYNDSMNVIYRLYDTNNLIDFSLLSNYIDEYTKENPTHKVIIVSDHKHNIHKFSKLFKYVNITCGDNTAELMQGMKIKEELLTSKHNVTLCMFSGTERLIKDNKIGKKVPKVIKIK